MRNHPVFVLPIFVSQGYDPIRGGKWNVPLAIEDALCHFLHSEVKFLYFDVSFSYVHKNTKTHSPSFR